MSEIQDLSDADIANLSVGNQICAGRLAEGTKKNYAGMMNRTTEWFSSSASFKGYVVNGELDVSDISADVWKIFLSSLMKKRKKGVDVPDEYNSFQHVNGYVSAIKDFYKQKKVRFPDPVKSMVDELLNGYKRHIGELKLRGDMALVDGKTPLTFAAYCILAETTMKSCCDFQQSMYAHLYLLLCWNLMARCVSVGGIMFEHISWEQDSIVFKFPTHKGDKEGQKCAPKHTYANMEKPELSVILSLAIYVFSKGARRAESSKTLFPGIGKNCEKRFSSWLKSACGQARERLLTVGCDEVKTGTHSFRKGVATFLSGMLDGPSQIAVFLRAGWTLGSVVSRYIFECPGQDQLCGRCASGVSILSHNFAALPPHFNSNEQDGVLTEEQWENILPGYQQFYPVSFRQTIPFLLANVVYHKDWLERNLNRNHPLFSSSLWTSGILTNLRDQVHTGISINDVTGLSATGIPLSVQNYYRVQQIMEALNSSSDRIIGNSNTGVTSIMERLNSLPVELRNEITENFSVNGVSAVTNVMLQQELDRRDELHQNRYEELKRYIGTMLQRTHNAVVETNINGAIEEHHDSSLYTWGGRLCRVPESFEFPLQISVHSLWKLWFFGDTSNKICPFRFLTGLDLKSKNEGQRLSKARGCIGILMKYSEHSITEISSLTQIALSEEFNKVFMLVNRKIYPEISDDEIDLKRLYDLCYGTYYQKALKALKEK